MRTLIDSILRLGAEELATEEAACRAIVALRFPHGITCPHCASSTTRSLAHVTCSRIRKPHRFTILYGTPFALKRAISVRALLLAIRAFAVTHRSISARELARELLVNHVTLWRWLHTLRALMPKTPLIPTSLGAVATISSTAGVRCGGKSALKRDGPGRGGTWFRLVAQSVRTWINGTFHGVSYQWLSLYLKEMSARWRYGGAIAIEEMLTPLVVGGAALTFDRVRLAAAQ